MTTVGFADDTTFGGFFTYDTATWELITSVTGSETFAYDLATAPDGSLFKAVGSEETLFDPATFEIVSTSQLPVPTAFDLFDSPTDDDLRFVVSSTELIAFSRAMGEEIITVPTELGRVTQGACRRMACTSPLPI